MMKKDYTPGQFTPKQRAEWRRRQKLCVVPRQFHSAISNGTYVSERTKKAGSRKRGRDLHQGFKRGRWFFRNLAGELYGHNL